MDHQEPQQTGTRRFWSDNAALGLATLVAGLFNTLYSLFLAHALGPFDYGRVAALNNVVGLFLLPLPIIGLVAIRVGRQPGQRWLVAGTLGLGGSLFLAAVLLSASLGRNLHLPARLIVLYTVTVVFNFGYALYMGFLERSRHYRLVGALLVASSGLGVLCVLLAVTVGRPHPLAWLGVLQAVAVAALFLGARHYGESLPAAPPRRLTSTIVATTLGVGTLQAFWGFSDSLWAKAHLNGVDAGLYTGLTTIGQALPFVVSSLATVMLTAILDEPQERFKYLSRTLLATLAVAGLFLGVLALFPTLLVRLALGPAFLPMSPLIQRYSDAMAALSLVVVMTTYGVAVGAYSTMVGAALGTLIWILALIPAHTMSMLVNRTLGAMLLTLVLVGGAFLLSQRKNRSPASGDRFPS